MKYKFNGKIIYEIDDTHFYVDRMNSNMDDNCYIGFDLEDILPEPLKIAEDLEVNDIVEVYFETIEPILASTILEYRCSTKFPHHTYKTGKVKVIHIKKVVDPIK